MKFTAWIDYPSMSIAIQETTDGFRCSKYVDRKVIRSAHQSFETIDELEGFLMELPYPPMAEIRDLIQTLKAEK